MGQRQRQARAKPTTTTTVMKYTNTHIRTLATLLAFVSVILTPSATAAGSSENSDKTNQTTEQASAQPTISLQQRRKWATAWVSYLNQQDIKLKAYIDSCGEWLWLYNGIAVPAIKKHGNKQEQEMADVISKDIKDFRKELEASWARTRKSGDIFDQASSRSSQNPTEKNFATAVQKANDFTNSINTESENFFKIGQSLAGYHQQVTALLDGIIARLSENPKTQADADKIDSRWKREPDFLKVKAPIKMIPLDPTKPMTPVNATPQSPSGKAGAKQVRVRKVNQ